ncbi:unnamed protein product [Ambrosiozyma monospora]|uniref:Unnamed protein product n=1 Tax=Ambrosiozyma monospora TaxID=43982 RepID=A0A9W6YW95_AMBMO|nr:unnamed protein product [Ambrosiozyma monospora]
MLTEKELDLWREVFSLIKKDVGDLQVLNPKYAKAVEKLKHEESLNAYFDDMEYESDGDDSDDLDYENDGDDSDDPDYVYQEEEDEEEEDFDYSDAEANDLFDEFVDAQEYQLGSEGDHGNKQYLSQKSNLMTNLAESISKMSLLHGFRESYNELL